MITRALLILIYGIIVALGGIIGYLKAGSTVSLIMGSIFGVLLIASALFLSKKWLLGNVLAILLTVVLFIFFSFRFVKNPSPPPGILAIVSFIVLLLYGWIKD